MAEGQGHAPPETGQAMERLASTLGTRQKQVRMQIHSRVNAESQSEPLGSAAAILLTMNSNRSR